MNRAWSWLAEGVVVLHFAYLAYLIGGGFAAWRWPRSIVAHVLAVGWAVLIVVTKVPCPLTSLQNSFRERAGQQPLSGSFIDTYARGTLFPAGAIGLAQALVAIVVALSWVGFAHAARPGPQRSHRPGH